MLNGTTYMVRPFMEPRNSSSSLVRISAGAFQLFVGPASASLAEQMKVRSSTRATSLGSEWAQYDPGRFAGSSSVKVPASTSCLQRRACSSADPSNQWTSSGWQSSTISSTQARSRALRVGACTSATLRLQSTDRKLGADHCIGASPATPKWAPKWGTALKWRTALKCRKRSDLGAGEPHVDLGAEPDLDGPPVGVEVEVDALALAQRLEEGALERVGGEG